MVIQTNYPYQDYNGYLVINSENRTNICLVHKETKQRTTLSYARYLMSVKEGRILDSGEHVDHVNGDKTDDRIDNLQILSISDNNKKRNIEQGTTKLMVTLKCPSCNKEFDREAGKTFLKKGGKYTACSRSCSYEVLRQGYSTNELKMIGESQVVKYFRHKGL